MAYDEKWHDDLELDRIIRTPRPIKKQNKNQKNKNDVLESASISLMDFQIQPKVPVDAFDPMSFDKPVERISSMGTQVFILFISIVLLALSKVTQYRDHIQIVTGQLSRIFPHIESLFQIS
jgi:hypothetical protein